MVEWDEREIEQEENEHSHCHAEEHVACGGSSYVYAVPNEGCHAADREEECPWEIDANGSDYVCIACQYAHEPWTCYNI